MDNINLSVANAELCQQYLVKIVESQKRIESQINDTVAALSRIFELSRDSSLRGVAPSAARRLRSSPVVLNPVDVINRLRTVGGRSDCHALAMHFCGDDTSLSCDRVRRAISRAIAAGTKLNIPMRGVYQLL